MTGQQFETEFCELMKAFGYWALNIPRNKSGAQPFDVIAIHGWNIFAVDCKVCGRNSFPLDRVEDNQWTAFKVVHDRTDARVGIVAYHKGDIYFLSYSLLLAGRRQERKSIPLVKPLILFSKDDIKDILGRYME